MVKFEVKKVKRLIISMEGIPIRSISIFEIANKR